MQSSHMLVARVAVALFLILLAASQPTGANALPTLALVHGTLIDGMGSSPIPDAVVLIQGDKILAAGSVEEISIPSSAEVIDVQGATILPGFIDAHVHDGFNPANLQAWAQAGVTTVRDEGTRASGLKAQLDTRSGELGNPKYDRIVSAGAMMTVTLNTTFSVLKSYGAPLGTPVDNLRRFVEMGGVVVLGNDYAGGRDLSAFELGMPMFEIEKMSEAGMTPMQIIMASTYNAADACNKLNEIGTIEPGKFADVLVVRGDPLEDIHALTNVQMVVHLGVVIRK